MGAGASSSDPLPVSEAAALAQGFTQEQIDEHKAKGTAAPEAAAAPAEAASSSAAAIDRAAREPGLSD